jgi:(p)ppGpp synthase/HD superfamily hydrolase|tara:strand:- start:624 stop:1130 length:507 start_codon:yes stop_codon:yes gene_type:complete
MSVTDRALTFATAAHAAVGQKRKYDGEDYIVHPIRVADIVRTYGGSDDQIAAAYLHDVVEDTQVDIDTIRDMFGDTIAELVSDLTDVSCSYDGNRATRKSIDMEHTLSGSVDAQFVKLADILDNSQDIRQADPSFWKVYQKEMLALLDGMTECTMFPLYAKALDSVKR